MKDCFKFLSKISINNKIEKNAKIASANICLAEYHKKDRNISEQYFVTANNHIANMQRAPIYARQQMYIDLVNYFKNFDEKKILEKVDKKKGEGLIFIVGMPRSGTTLVEQIISCHSQVYGGGELELCNQHLWPLIKNEQDMSKEILENFRAQYLDAIQGISNGKSFVTDKMPSNFRYIGLIKRALPESIVIHVKRDPAAVCWPRAARRATRSDPTKSCEDRNRTCPAPRRDWRRTPRRR